MRHRKKDKTVELQNSNRESLTEIQGNNNESYFDWLSDELVLKIILYLSLRDISHLEQAYSRFQSISSDRTLVMRYLSNDYFYHLTFNMLCYVSKGDSPETALEKNSHSETWLQPIVPLSTLMKTLGALHSQVVAFSIPPRNLVTVDQMKKRFSEHHIALARSSRESLYKIILYSSISIFFATIPVPDLQVAAFLSRFINIFLPLWVCGSIALERVRIEKQFSHEKLEEEAKRDFTARLEESASLIFGNNTSLFESSQGLVASSDSCSEVTITIDDEENTRYTLFH